MQQVTKFLNESLRICPYSLGLLQPLFIAYGGGGGRDLYKAIISYSFFPLFLPLSLYFLRERMKSIGLERWQISNEITIFF